MTSRAIVAFGENGAFMTIRPNGGYFYNGKIPKGIKYIIDGAKGHTYFWVSMGPGGQFYVGWKRKDGQEFYKLGIDDGVYEDLDTKLDNMSSLEKVKVIFGPKKGSWFVITGKGGYSSRNVGSHTGLASDIDSTDSGVRHVALGRDGAWAVAYRDGSVSCDLMGNYGILQRVLHDMSDGDLRGVFVNPFSSSQFVVGYKNGGKKSSMPSDWHEHVKF